ncbi:uncharacterized protein BX664DRAFT_339482 [Halteromyces radiatus]|uniref:uncharacterized protein n=1 Tax=Halteromyces radiatus TaxID=101107 RepID=UPI00221E7134|nr:uncharacterized protein BX664DRAFT_339482 [Halteromyces radiatus]KAI8082955.1 hypothetical protein BX664DRAFT_339482 [Halteromyces radiatus]
MSPIMFFPATCELCGHWIPQHAGSCPRNGVHPSQWSIISSCSLLSSSIKEEQYHQENHLFSFVCPDHETIMDDDQKIDVTIDMMTF